MKIRNTKAWDKIEKMHPDERYALLAKIIDNFSEHPALIAGALELVDDPQIVVRSILSGKGKDFSREGVQSFHVEEDEPVFNLDDMEDHEVQELFSLVVDNLITSGRSLAKTHYLMKSQAISEDVLRVEAERIAAETSAESGISV